MTLSGVLKDILLVCASMAIWHSPVTLIQFFGYSMALAGMVYYKLGREKIQQAFSDGGRKWAEYGIKHPIQRKLLVLFLSILTIFLLATGLAPQFGYDPKQAVSDGSRMVSSALGKTGN